MHFIPTALTPAHLLLLLLLALESSLVGARCGIAENKVVNVHQSSARVAFRSVGLSPAPITVNINRSAVQSSLKIFLHALCLEAAYCLDIPADRANTEIAACVREKLEADPLTSEGLPATDDLYYQKYINSYVAARQEGGL